jgi:GR25 family glycosyltransferase involved in LPS biosynthesis
LRTAVGSLLEGLTPEERSEIDFKVFIPHSDPTVHPSYTEDWLPSLVDDIVVYNVDDRQMEQIRVWEAEAGLFREKGLYDYSYLLKACYKQGTPYIAMFEDDVVAVDGWYHRTQAALEQAEALAALKSASPDFLYLRLFHTEEFLGWNSEEWKTYVVYSALFVALPVVALTAIRRMGPHGKRIASDRVIFASVPISIALVVILFSLGRVTVRPPPDGVIEMPRYGCCSQGFVFPREKAMTLVRWFEEKHVGFVDVLTEEYADQHNELRFAIVPSVIQHVGRKSSKIDDYGPDSKHGLSVAEKIWNFRFEKYQPEKLRSEHLLAAEKKSALRT